MADVSFDVDQLDQMKRPQLQKLCKKLGIKANSKTNQLISDLKEYNRTYSAQQNEKIKTPSSSQEVKESVESPTKPGKTSKLENETPVGEEKSIEQDDSFKREMIIHLENKVKETMKESKIPRLNGKAVTFVKTPTNTSSKTREHAAFKKMDSIDVYLEKKRKRAESFYQNVKKAKTTAATARTIIAEMKASHNTPPRKTPDKRKSRTADKSVTITTKAFTFGQIKSPKVSGFGFTSQKPKTPTTRKSSSVPTRAKENKTPSMKSLLTTPFRFNATTNTTITPAPAKKKFDLQASLSKPLPYKPHTGKLTSFKFSKNESKIPVKTKTMAFIEKKVDIKNVKITSRAERREKEKSIRANKRKNSVLQRRGLVN